MSIRDYGSSKPPKKDRVWLSSCIELANEADGDLKSLALGARGVKATSASARTPAALRMRRKGTQGAPFKCAVIREALFDWFVDIRTSVATNITPRLVLMKAKELGEIALAQMRKSGEYTPLLVLDRGWLLRWKRDYGVTLRKPTQRYKCSKAVLLERLCAMWLNVIRIRRFFGYLTGVDVGLRIIGIDEKPIHMNEGGSKGVRTLEIAGAKSVKLKENHAATRERVSVMTCVCSDPAAATQPRFPPVSLSVCPQVKSIGALLACNELTLRPKELNAIGRRGFMLPEAVRSCFLLSQNH